MVNETINVVSDNDEETETSPQCPELQGYLNKWTNYIYGWQKRWIVLKDGALSYYKARNETECGCRGAMSLYKAYIKAHEFDPCRFDVAVNDCAWCLRAESPEEKDRWLKALILSKQQEADASYNCENNLERHGSSASLQSNNPFVGSSSNSSLTFQKSPELKSQLIEIDTLRESLCKQIDTLYDQYVSYLPAEGVAETEHSPVVEFKVDVMTCKTTVLSISDILENCIEIVSLQEDSFAKCLEQETNKRSQLQEMYGQRIVNNNLNKKKESETRPNHEDEFFYDAVEAGLEVTNNSKQLTKPDENENNVLATMSHKHRLSEEIDRVTMEQVRYAKMGIGKDAWQLFAEEGEMKMYKREEEVNGVVIDPLKACHFVRGFTGREICNYFFDPAFRYEWETTLETNGMTVLEKLDEDSIIFHQIHKRAWPATQRDAIFWSHMREIPRDASDDEQVYNSWIVVNHSTNSDSHPASANGKFVRIDMTVCLLCQTVILDESKDLSELTRNDVACKIMYCAVINPGGWVPSSALRVIYKREYPRFLRKFTAYVTQKTKGKPVLL